MTNAAPFLAAYAEFKMVKTRQVLQIVFEAPLEQAEDILSSLGIPKPGAEMWCAIAPSTYRQPAKPVAEKAATAPAETEEAAAIRKARGKDRLQERARETYAGKDGDEKALTRCSLLCKDAIFREWFSEHYALGFEVRDEDDAVTLMRDTLGVGSRREILSNPVAFEKFIAIETAWKQASGRMAEQR